MDRLPVTPAEPSWRKPAGIFLILLLIAVWAVLVTIGADLLAGLPWPVFAVYFLVAGIAWIAPLKPLLRWMETGRFRTP
jgi:carbon starvation protein CstA